MRNSIKFIVSKSNILHNFNCVKEKVNNAKICAIVKANAYGIGLKPTVQSLKGMVDFFGVSNCVEAKQVRNIDNLTPILVLMPITLKQAIFCSKNNISMTVQNSTELLQFANLNIPLNIHIKINTGLNRFGQKSTKDFLIMQEVFLMYPQLKFQGIFTHFACSDRQNEMFFNMQYSVFKNYLNLIYPEFNPIRHCCNSAALLKGGEKLLDMVRVGKVLYGYNPIPDIANINLKPVVTITTRIMNIFNITKGEYVGYNTNFKAQKDMKIATIQIGFADGYKRAYSNVGKVIINNTYCNIVGNVCMDSCMVDVTHIQDLKMSDKVIVLGKSEHCEISANHLAQLANTTIYEILCTLHTGRMSFITKD